MDPSAPAATIHAAVAPALAALGVEQIRVTCSGPPGRLDLLVTCWLGPRVAASATDLRGAVSARIPAAIDYHSLEVRFVGDFPVTEPDLEVGEIQRRLRSAARWRLLGVVFVVAFLAFMAWIFVGGRGDLVARAELHGPGTVTARFRSDGRALAIWASLNGDFPGAHSGVRRGSTRYIMPVTYDLEALAGGHVVHRVSHFTRADRLVNKKYCTAAPDCEIYLGDLPKLPAGPLDLRVTGQPRADVTRVDDMSLLLRRDTVF